VEPTDTATLLEIIRALQAQNATLLAEITRLVRMVQSLTGQLDVMLRDGDEERRAKLIADRAAAAEVLAQARAAALALAEPAQSPAGHPPASGVASQPPNTDSKAACNRHPHGRGPVPDGVQRVDRTLSADVCPNCKGSKLTAGRRVGEPIDEWDYVRSHLRRHRTIRVACTCDDCGTEIDAPPPPPMPFERAACTFEVIAWVCYGKCGMSLPTDRMTDDFALQGTPMASATLTRWWQRGADLLLPIAAAVRASLLLDTHIRTDGTGLQVTFPRVKANPKKGPARPGDVDDDGYLVAKEPIYAQILVFGNDDHAVYWYTPTRHGIHTLDFLTIGHQADGTPIRWEGTITADAFSANDLLFEDGTRTESGCNAHGFRKFRDQADKAPLLASRAMAYIGQVFGIEAAARDAGLTDAALLAHRREHAGPVVDAFRAWLDTSLGELLPTNPVRKAMQYYLNHWKALTRFLEDPKVHLDNNWSERALRRIALLRNNSLTAGGEDGARRLCTLFTLIHTCRILKVDPYQYLVWALTRVVPHPDNRAFTPAALTPSAYKVWRESSA
jgi:transposase